jgi:hypothetical protein
MDNTFVIDRAKLNMLISRHDIDPIGAIQFRFGYNFIQVLDLFAIRNEDGTYEILKARHHYERGVVSEEDFVKILKKYKTWKSNKSKSFVKRILNW